MLHYLADPCTNSLDCLYGNYNGKIILFFLPRTQGPLDIAHPIDNAVVKVVMCSRGGSASEA